MDALTSDLELRRLRTELAEKQFALENIKGEWDRWRTPKADRWWAGAPRARSPGTRRGNGGGG
jgi:hypothetical protein